MFYPNQIQIQITPNLRMQTNTLTIVLKIVFLIVKFIENLSVTLQQINYIGWYLRFKSQLENLK